jgi:ABC-type glycerol-3-phosphate transport system permease component
MTSRRRKVRLGEMLAAAVLMVLLAVSLLPFVMMLLLSLKTNADIFTRFWGCRNLLAGISTARRQLR